jgi:hypothetical protein
MFFFGEKNHGYIPNQSFEFSENEWVSEPVPELTSNGYLYLILQEPSPIGFNRALLRVCVEN